MAEPIDMLIKELTQLTVSNGFLDVACERMTKEFGESWRDASRKVSYKWGTLSSQPKEGDEAEREVIRHLASEKMCELLGEPVYIISGRSSNLIWQELFTLQRPIIKSARGHPLLLARE